MPTLVALVVCLVEGREAVFRVFLGKGHLGVGPSKGDKRRDYVISAGLGVSVAPSAQPVCNGFEGTLVVSTSRSPLFAVITIIITEWCGLLINDYCEGDLMRKLKCRPKQHIFAKWHIKCVFSEMKIRSGCFINLQLDRL